MTSNYPPDDLYPERPASARTSCRRSRCSSNGSTSSRSTAASTTGCARSSSVQPSTCPPGAVAMRRWRARSSAMRSGPDEDPRSSRSKAASAVRQKARRQRRLVRLRRAVRRPALAARLPRARAALRGTCSCPTCRGLSADMGDRGAPLHLARRRPLRSSRKAAGCRPRRRAELCTAKDATARNFRAPSAG